MGTRAAAFNAKIQNLLDYHLRLIHGVVPPPSGLDITVTLKYFSQTLLGVLKDIQETPFELLQHRGQDVKRLSLFPSLDYGSLHQALTQLVDVIPLVQFGAQAMGEALLHTICCLLVFCERELIDTLPYLVTSMIAYVPETMHQNIITTLCYNILPFTVGADRAIVSDLQEIETYEENYAEASIPGILMLIFQYTDNSAQHSQLLECLMAYKKDIIKDLFSVIAHGTPKARPAAANLIFYYWPNLNPTLNDRRGIHIRFADISSVLKAMFNKSAQAANKDSQSDSGESKIPKGWKQLHCQLDECVADGRRRRLAVKVCLDHTIALGAQPEAPPPLYLCLDCSNSLVASDPTVKVKDMYLPMGQVAASCENKNCRSTDNKNAVATCFSDECVSYNGNKPIRICAICNNVRHNNRRGTNHIVHTTLSSVWSLDVQFLHYVIEAIVSLLNEATPLGDKGKTKDQERLSRACLLEEDQVDDLSFDDRKLLSRYGIWLIIGLCVPNEDTPIPVLGRLLGTLCHWFSSTQYLPDDQHGSSIERLKTDYVQGWLLNVSKSHFDVFVSCLLPHPVEYAKVGGHWDTLAKMSDHIKEGFRRLFCLVPYDLITITVWEKVMPHWMEAIHNDVPEKELIGLKITLNKLLDPEMSPLGFDSTQMYNFIANRFCNSKEEVQEQTLSWLQLLSSLSITIPIYQLMEMFQDGVKSLLGKNIKVVKAEGDEDVGPMEPVMEDHSEGEGEWADENKKSFDETKDEEETQLEKTLTCFILMLDVFLKQLEVQEIEKHKGVMGPVGIPFLTLMKEMLQSPCLAPHSCSGDQYCSTCDLTITYFQLTMDIQAYLLPLLAIQNNRVVDMMPPEPEIVPEKTKEKVEPPPCITEPPQLKMGQELAFLGLAAVVNMPQIVTATVEMVGELDIVANMPQEQVMAANATSVTITEEDVAKDKTHATACVDKASVVGANDEPIDCTKPLDAEEEGCFWETSQGKFKFKLDQLPPHLQVIYALLELLEKAEDGDVVYHLCECLRYLILHGESFAQAASDHRGFIIWCQESKDINLMWSLLEAEWSHVAEICVALLLHFLTLPCGADIFWKLCENHFHHSDWKVRFQAVEKVVVIGRFLTVASVKQCPGLQAAIAHAFCFLLASLDDLNVSVAQRAQLCLTSLPDSGLRALGWCLEQQFDSVILDRPMIIQALHQLSSLLPERKILSWEFFYNRFDALYIEAQIALEKHGEIAVPRDLRNSDLTSDIFSRKLTRARDALSMVQNASAKTLSSSLGTKWPYKRTMSAPANMLNKVDKQERTPYRVEDYTLKGLCTIPCKLFEAYFIDVMQAADGGMKVFDDGSMVHQLQRAMELEVTDLDTLHLLMFLLMHYLSQPQHTGGTEEKRTDKVMNFVLRHISIMMGYSVQERQFTISPAKLRSSPVLNAFLSNLPQVLDHNFNMGKILLATCIPVLQYCPAPHRINDLRYPNFSLWHLQPHPRRWWLTSVLTIIYKFDYTQQLLSSQIISLIKIVLITLENHFHQCKKVTDSTNLAYSREVSQGSLGEMGVEVQQDTTPPQSPNAPQSANGSRNQPVATTSTAHDHKSAFSPLAQEQKNGTEKQLTAIPESPKVEIHEFVEESVGSNQGLKGEQAVVRIEKQDSPKEHITTSIVMPQVKTHGVTSVMASQIQAFHESYTVKIHDAELVQATAFDASSEISETISLDDNNHSWSTDSKDVSVATTEPNKQEQQQQYSQQKPSYIFRPILATQERSHSVQEPSAKELIMSAGSDQENQANSGASRLQSVIIHKPVVITPQCVQAHAIEAKKIEPRIVRVHSTDSNQGRHFSPQSPMSMMDLITLGSPVEVDAHSISISEHYPQTLELKTPERLLHVGVGEDSLNGTDMEDQDSALDKVWQSFEGYGNNNNGGSINGDSVSEVHEIIITDGKRITRRKIPSKETRVQSIKEEERGKMQKQVSAEEASEISNTVTVSSISGDREPSSRSEAIRSNGKNKYWEEIGSNYYSWSEPSEGSSTKEGAKGSQPPPQPTSSTKQSSLRVGDETMLYRCMECGEVLEEFANDDLGLCIIILSTFVQREPALAAPHLTRMLKTVSRVAGLEVFSWQVESPMHLPGSATSIGRQFLRCVLHQLAPNRIFNQIFQTDIPGKHKVKLFRTLAKALTDFNELNPSAPIQLLLENLNIGKHLPCENNLGHIIGNVAVYMECATMEGNVGGLSSVLIPLFDTFLKKIPLNVASIDNFGFLMRLLINVMSLQGIAAHKERGKILISRMVVFELVQAMKFKATMPDTNIILIIQLILQ